MTRYVIHIPVYKVEKIGGLWYVKFFGLPVSINFGEEKLFAEEEPWKVGDVIKITYEKVETHDQPEQPPEQ